MVGWSGVPWHCSRGPSPCMNARPTHETSEAPPREKKKAYKCTIEEIQTLTWAYLSFGEENGENAALR